MTFKSLNERQPNMPTTVRKQFVWAIGWKNKANSVQFELKDKICKKYLPKCLMMFTFMLAVIRYFKV